jgi:hypothetical protein
MLKAWEAMSARCSVRKMKGWLGVNTPISIAFRRPSPTCRDRAAHRRVRVELRSTHHEVGDT